MEPRLTLITLGVADIARATAFYVRLGFVRSAMSNDNVSFFQAGGVVLALYERAALAEDALLPADAAGVHAPAGFAGVSLAHNARSAAEVDAVLAEAQAIGANVREGTADLGALRAEVESNLTQIESLVNDINRKWPFAREHGVKLP